MYANLPIKFLTLKHLILLEIYIVQISPIFAKMSLLHALTIAVVMEDVMEEEFANVCQDFLNPTVLPDFKRTNKNKYIFLIFIINIIK